MAIDAGRVGVRKDQVDAYGRVVATDYLLEQIANALGIEYQPTLSEPTLSSGNSTMEVSENGFGSR